MSGPRHGSVALALGALLLSGASTAGLTVFRGLIAHHPPPPRPVYGTLPDFALVDDQHRPISRSTLQGSVWIADFIFARCPGQCPFLSAQMAALQRFFRDAPHVRLVSFSVEPSVDTPEVLAAYAARYRAPGGRWQFVTGEPSAMTTLIQDGFRLAVGLEGSAKEPITHSLRLVLVDPRGAIRGYYDAADPRAMARLREEATHLAR